MDAQQFETLMKAIVTSNEKVLTAVLRRECNHQNGEQTGNVIVVPNFESFDSNKEQFNQYLERFNNYMLMKGLKNEDKMSTQLFLNSIGAELYGLLSTLITPKTINELTFKEICSTLQIHLSPKKNVMVERHKFLCCFQEENQSLADYVTVLRKNAITCDFTCSCKESVAEKFLASQFIRGIRQNQIREQLLMDPDLIFAKMIEKAFALEASKINSSYISNKVTDESSHSNDVNSISKRYAYDNQGMKPNPNRRIIRKINFKDLGIEDLCLRCGRNNHVTSSCRINQKTLKCSSCNRQGHVQKVCIKTLIQRNSNIKYVENEPSTTFDFDTSNHSNNADEFYQLNKIWDLIDINTSESRSYTQKYFIDVLLEGKKQRFEVDSGAGLTLLPEKDFEKLQLKVEVKPTTVRFRSYTSGIFEPLGIATVRVTCNNQTSMEDLYVVPDKFSPLLGRAWIRKFGIELSDIDTNQEYNLQDSFLLNEDSATREIENKYSDIFKPEIGCIPNITCSLQLRENAKPIFIKDRPVPFALREKVENELDELEKSGIITRVNYSDWGSPLVIIPKPDGNVRLCVDYKNTVNPQLKDSNYPIPKIDEVLNDFRNAEYFCTIDLYKAYLHVQVDEESALIQTISTHRGTYKVNRLSFGIKTAPSDFHRILAQALSGLKGLTRYFDDLTVYGTTFEDCYMKLVALLDRLREFNIHVNRNKCQFFKKEINYLGYVVKKNAILKSPKKIQAILDLPQPKNKEELRRFLGMVTHYSKFIPNVSSITYPLRELLQKNRQFVWSPKCESAFIQLRNEIVSERILIPFHPDLPVTVACDASPTGIAGVLSHVIDGVERPVVFVSRSLSKAEQNYSQLDREALAIVFTVGKFFNYLYGRAFTLISDNKPLTRIFNHDTKLPQMTSARLLRYAVFLQGFNYRIEHRSAEKLCHVDCLSRATVQAKHWSTDMSINCEVRDLTNQTINQIASATLTFEKLIQETSRDPILNKLLSELKEGKVSDPELSIQGNIILKGNRAIIPKALQVEVLKELHRTHVGIVKMKQLARRYCWWSTLDKDIESMVKSCPDCAKVKKDPAKAPTHHWDEPSSNFQRIHIDYAGPIEGFYCLVLVDAKSKWPEVRISNSAPTSQSTISLLADIFSFHGLPEVLVSDNATIFTSNEFKRYCETNGIIQKFIAPGHPATNGLAERYIQTLKNKLTSMKSSGTSLKSRVQEIISRYRATPQYDNLSPAEKYLGRRLRTKLDILIPQTPRKVQENSLKVRHINVGDRVQARWYTPNAKLWKLGVVVDKLGRLHYKVKLDNGYELKRHIDQLIPCSVRLSQEGEPMTHTTASNTHTTASKPKLHNPMNISKPTSAPSNDPQGNLILMKQNVWSEPFETEDRVQRDTETPDTSPESREENISHPNLNPSSPGTNSNSSSQVVERNEPPPTQSIDPRRSKRTRQRSTWLKDYV